MEVPFALVSCLTAAFQLYERVDAVRQQLELADGLLHCFLHLYEFHTILKMETNTKLVMHGYFRSGASWRLRIVLALKQLPYEMQYVSLIKGEHKTEEYAKINPAKVRVSFSFDRIFSLCQLCMW